jgi:hypothetical protein
MGEVYKYLKETLLMYGVSRHVADAVVAALMGKFKDRQ